MDAPFAAGRDVRLAVGTDRPAAPRASELARASFHTPQTAGELLQRLERRGLIERTTGRGRIIENHLTRAGQNTLRQATAAVETVITQALADFDAEDRAAFTGLATRFVTSLARRAHPSPPPT